MKLFHIAVSFEHFFFFFTLNTFLFSSLLIGMRYSMSLIAKLHRIEKSKCLREILNFLKIIQCSMSKKYGGKLSISYHFTQGQFHLFNLVSNWVVILIISEKIITFLFKGIYFLLGKLGKLCN